MKSEIKETLLQGKEHQRQTIRYYKRHMEHSSSEPSETAKAANALFQAPDLRDNIIFLLFKPPSLWYLFYGSPSKLIRGSSSKILKLNVLYYEKISYKDDDTQLYNSVYKPVAQ